MRSNTHITETKSIKKVLNSLPDHWVIRELSERDYGTDLVIEIFSPCGKDKNGYVNYDTTGAICNIQLKGTINDIKINSDDNMTVSQQIPKKTLLYAEKFPVPFFLFKVNVSSNSSDSYFVWLQRYITDVLDQKEPNWRTSSKDKHNIRIPINNVLKEGMNKIEKISSRIKYIEELVSFIEIYGNISDQLISISEGKHNDDDETFDYILNNIKKISRLNTLLKQNKLEITHTSIEELYNFVEDVKYGIKKSDDLEYYPHRDFLDMIGSEVGFLSSLENTFSDYEGETVY